MTVRDSLRLLIAPWKQTRLEYLARITTAGIIAGFALAILAGILGRYRSTGHDIELIARRPAVGGWSRERIVVNQGERVRLRIRAEDVVHGFAIGRMGVDAGPIEPGKVTAVEFVADQPGEFTYYCTMWCDPNHARMRGVLEVRGSGVTPSPSRAPASDVTLQHLDDPRDAGIAPQIVPSPTRGLPLFGERCARCHGERGEGGARGGAVGRREYLAKRRPVDVFQFLGGSRTQRGSVPVDRHGGGASATRTAVPPHATYAGNASDQERWDVVAALWSLATTADRLELGERLYAKNCAACHGEGGTGNGPGGTYQPKAPANFTDAGRMLAGTTALLTAKVRRGGMGTGMPYWGSIFTEDELAAVVDYLWTFSLGTAR